MSTPSFNQNSSIPKSLPLGLSVSLIFLSSAALCFEINLTRLFSVMQFYHFAFLIVSLAMLGYGSSGTFLALYPLKSTSSIYQKLGWTSLATAFSISGSFLFINWIPFDSYSIAWNAKQVLILVLHYLILALPFFFAGLGTGMLLAAYSHIAGKTYMLNLVGSAIGCLTAVIAPNILGGEGTVVLSSLLAGTASLFCMIPSLRNQGNMPKSSRKRSSIYQRLYLSLLGIVMIFSLVDNISRMLGKTAFPFLEVRISPYKGLSYGLQYPGARLIFQKWNGFSRLDVIRSPGVHSLPGLSYRYMQVPPSQDGLYIDGDDLSPIVIPDVDPSFTDYMSSAFAFLLHPDAETLILEPHGGLDIFTAQALGASKIVATEANPLILDAASQLYQVPNVSVVVETGRSFLRRTNRQFDVIVYSLTSTYHPVSSGAYSLAEDYRMTVESLQDALSHLKPEGILIITRWLQNPPSESLRLFGLAVTALEALNLAPIPRLIAYRGYNTATIGVKTNPFTFQELTLLRDFTSRLAFDLVYTPDIRPEETNVYNILPESIYYQTFHDLIYATERERFYRQYAFDVRPSTDDHPFFGHFFKWSQTPQILAEYGKTLQPFGGAGYFVMLALLAVAILLSGLVIWLPTWFTQYKEATRRSLILPLTYFGFIGMAYLLIEIPLLQRFILFIGQPAFSMAAVLFILLSFSGLGSLLSQHIPLRLGVGILILVLILISVLLPSLIQSSLGLPFISRLGVMVLILGPLGFCMGLPFPRAIQNLASHQQEKIIPWAWSVNGAISVISSVLASLLALSLGFTWVFWIGALCYMGAWITAPTEFHLSSHRDPHQ